MFRGIRLTALTLALLVLAGSAFGTQATKQLATGVSLYQEIETSPESALIVNAITIDMKADGVSVRAALGGDVVCGTDATKGRENVSATTARRGALVGVNADFFPFTGDPLGVCVIDGELVSEPMGNRAAVAWSKNSGPIFDIPRLSASLTLPNGVRRQIDGINRSRNTNELVLYTGRHGTCTGNAFAGTDVLLASTELPVRIGKDVALTVSEVRCDCKDTTIPTGGALISAGGPAGWFLKENLKPGDVVTVRFDVLSACGHDWSQVEQAAGGGPWLLKGGEVCVDWEAEGFNSSFSSTKHPRTAVGVTVDGKMMLVTVDGRQFVSRGISLPDLAALMKRLGAVDAINLDGGGSTTMSVAGMVVNSPSGNEERPVADAVLVFADRAKCEDLKSPAIGGSGGEAAMGTGAQLALTANGQPLTDQQMEQVVWGTTGGIGFVNQKGYFTPISQRKGAVNALYGGQLVSLNVRVVAPRAAEVKVEITPDPADPLKASVNVKVLDQNHNNIDQKAVSLEVVGGKPDSAAGTTDANGEFVTAVTWDAGSPVRSVKATSDSVTGEATQ